VNRLSLTLGCLASLGSVAHADDAGMGAERVFTVSLDAALGTYLDSKYQDPATMMDVTETVTQMQYFLGLRGLIWDEDKKTPLGHTPGLWVEFGAGWIAAANAPMDAGFGDEGGGRLLINMKLSGPWQLYKSKHMSLGAGIGFGFGMQMGLVAVATS